MMTSYQGMMTKQPDKDWGLTITPTLCILYIVFVDGDLRDWRQERVSWLKEEVLWR